MIDLYTWPTPNSHKVHIMLEETGTPYNLLPLNIVEGEQFAPDFLKISLNNMVPAIVDREGSDGKPMALAESVVISVYLIKKTGHFLPADGADRYAYMQWVMTPKGPIRPTLGQAHQFRNYAVEKLHYAIDWFVNEATRLHNVLDKKLGETKSLAGNDYTIADRATFPWIWPWKAQGQDINEHPHLKRWFDNIYARPAVARGCTLLSGRHRKRAHGC